MNVLNLFFFDEGSKEWVFTPFVIFQIFIIIY